MPSLAADCSLSAVLALSRALSSSARHASHQPDTDARARSTQPASQSLQPAPHICVPVRKCTVSSIEQQHVAGAGAGPPAAPVPSLVQARG